MQKMQEIPSLGQEEGMATHSSILAWKIPMDRGAWRATVRGITKKVRHDWSKANKRALFLYLEGEKRAKCFDILYDF